jgi:dienelactone hydrolase
MAGAAPTPVVIPIDVGVLDADLGVPASSSGLVIFAHGSGSSRHSPRNKYVAGVLQARGLATLLADLLTAPEDAVDQRTARLRFDIDLLGTRVAAAIRWTRTQPALAGLPIGLFGASTGAAAALLAAAAEPAEVRAVVSRGGRPDLAGAALSHVEAPTLLLVGGLDGPVIDLNRQAAARMRGRVRLEIVPGASHLFEEPGTLEHVAARAAEWFDEWFRESAAARAADLSG